MANEVVNELEEVELRHLRKLPKLKNEFRYVFYFVGLFVGVVLLVCFWIVFGVLLIVIWCGDDWCC